MTSKNTTTAPKSWVRLSLQATFSPEYEGLCRYQKYERHELNAFNLCLINNGKSVIHTCHNKLHCSFYRVEKASPHFTFKSGIVFRVDVLDNQGSSSFNFHSSFVRWRNITMFLDTMTVINNHFDKCTSHLNTIESALNIIMWISVVPHQVGITTIVKVDRIIRFAGKTHTHTH